MVDIKQQTIKSNLLSQTQYTQDMFIQVVRNLQPQLGLENVLSHDCLFSHDP